MSRLRELVMATFASLIFTSGVIIVLFIHHPWWSFIVGFTLLAAGGFLIRYLHLKERAMDHSLEEQRWS